MPRMTSIRSTDDAWITLDGARYIVGLAGKALAVDQQLVAARAEATFLAATTAAKPVSCKFTGTGHPAQHVERRYRFVLAEVGGIVNDRCAVGRPLDAWRRFRDLDVLRVSVSEP